jgi:hypothetical protein
MKLTGKRLIPVSSKKCKCGKCKCGNHQHNVTHTTEIVPAELPPEIQKENNLLRTYAKKATGSPFIRIQIDEIEN